MCHQCSTLNKHNKLNKFKTPPTCELSSPGRPRWEIKSTSRRYVWFSRRMVLPRPPVWVPRHLAAGWNGWLVQNCYERNTSSFGVGISSADFLQKFDVRPSISIICNDLRRVKLGAIRHRHYVYIYIRIYISLNFEDLVKTLGISKDRRLETVEDMKLPSVHPLPGYLVPSLVVSSHGSLPPC